MIDSKRSSFIKTLEFVIDEHGNKHYVYPMKIDDYYIVQDLFANIDDYMIANNLPIIETDEETGETILNTEKYDSMMDLLEFALKEKRIDIEKWMDIKQIRDVLAKYRLISSLIVKLEKAEQEAGIIDFNVIFAGLTQHTSLTRQEIKEMTFAELEELYEGIKITNETEDATTEKPLKGKDAVDELKRLGLLG